MKGNSRKLAVFVIIAAIAMLTVVSTASAGLNSWWNYIIQGEYAVTGTANCIMAPGGGFNETTGPTPPPGVFYPKTEPTGPFQNSVAIYEGIYTFHIDGTGSFRGLGHNVTNPTPAGPLGPVTAALGEVNYKFTYTVGEGGLITFLLDPCTFTLCTPFVNGTCQAATGLTYVDNPPKYGVISPDGMNLNVTGGVPNIMTVQSGCPGGNPTPSNPLIQFICNISQTGFKVPKTFQLPTY